MSEYVNSTGFELVPEDSKSSMLPLHYKSICKLNRTRTHIARVVFWSVIQLHYKLICTPPWIRTKTELGLNQRPLPVGLVVLLVQGERFPSTALRVNFSSLTYFVQGERFPSTALRVNFSSLTYFVQGERFELSTSCF